MKVKYKIREEKRVWIEIERVWMGGYGGAVISYGTSCATDRWDVILDLVTHTNVDSHRSYPMWLQILISSQQYHIQMPHTLFYPNY